MKTISDYKKLARKSMKGSYAQGLGSVLLISALASVISMVFTALAGDSPLLCIAYNILSLIISFIIVNPLTVGVKKFFIEQGQGKPNMNSVFFAFKSNLSNVIKVMFVREIKLCLWLIIPELIGLVVAVAIFGVDSFVQTGVAGILMLENMSDIAAIVVVVLMFALMIPALIKNLEYTAVMYLLADCPDTKSKEVFKTARELMKGNKCRLFLLQFSFIGWLFLGICAFGIGMFLVLPYIEAATAQLYLDIKPKSEEKVSEFISMDSTDTFGV